MVDWKIAMLDKDIKDAAGFIHPVAMLRVQSLPYLLKIPSEMGLVKYLYEYPELRRLCLLPELKKDKPKDQESRKHRVTRGVTWRFRHHPPQFFRRVMLKLLIDMAICSGKVNYDLPFVFEAEPDEITPNGQAENESIDGFTVQYWVTESSIQQTPIVVAGKSISDLKNELQARKAHALKFGLSSELPLPARVRVNLSDQGTTEFWIDVPSWLDAYTNRRLYGTDTITNIGSSFYQKQKYTVCNTLLVRSHEGRVQVLLSKRVAGFGANSFILPGGKRKEGEESLEECVQRELREETGLRAKVSRPISMFSMKYPAKPHVRVVGALVEKFEGRLKHREPEQNTEWRWYDLEELPTPLFPSTRKIIDDYRSRVFPNLTWEEAAATLLEKSDGVQLAEVKQLELDL